MDASSDICRPMVSDADNLLLALELNLLHIACCVAWGGRIVLEAEDPSIVVVGQVLGFIGVWTCYSILRFALFLDKCIKAFFARSFILAWLSFQIQRLISKKENL